MSAHFRNTEDEGTQVQTVSRADGAEAASAHYREQPDNGKKKRTGLIVLVVVLSIVAVLGIVGGVVAAKLMDSAKTVKAEAQEVMSELNGIKTAIKDTDAEALHNISQNVSVKAHNIQDEVNTGVWSFAAVVPVYGQDVKSAQALADVLVDLSDNALVPLSSNTEIFDFKNLFHDGQVNIGVLQSLASALDQAAPVLSRSAKTIEDLPPAHIDQVSEMLDKAKDKIVSGNEMVQAAQQVMPYLPAMLGADGQTRRYLIIAQNNAELRSCGGLPGSWGVMTVTDGNMELGDFTSILHWPDLKADAQDDEHGFFATNFDTDPAQVNVVADFRRVGEMCKQYWSQAMEEDIDGVVALDPVFLQHMLALTGGFETYDGTPINGDNAAFELMSNVYWRFGNDNDAQDYFFSETAGLAAKSFFENIGDIGLTNFFKAFKNDIRAHRFLIWMSREEEQNIVRMLGADNEIDADTKQPELCILLDDDTYSKMSWYAGLDINVGEPVKNADGTTTYDVSFTVSNHMTEDEALYSPRYVSGYNTDKRSDGDMIDYVFVIAPAGGSVSDVNSEAADYVNMGTVYGHEGFRSHIFTNNGESSTFNMRVTVPADAENTLNVRATPLAQEGLLTINYAQPPAETDDSLL